MLVCAGAGHTVAQEMLTHLTSYKVSVLVSVPVALIKNTLTAQGKKGLFQEWHITPNPQKQHASQDHHVLSSLSWLPTLILLPQYLLYHWFLKSEFRLGRAGTEAE